MVNAATYVKRFLLANKADGITYRFPDVSGAMAEVDSTLRTAAAAAEYPQERRDSIRELVADVPGLLKAVTLPKDLKEYVARLVREVGTALDEYELTGDFKLDIAFTRLQTSLNIIAATPKDEKSQRTVMEFLQKRVVPCVAAVGFALGALADSATILEYLGYSPAQIESHEPRKTPEPPASDIPQAVQASDAHPENPQSDE